MMLSHMLTPCSVARIESSLTEIQKSERKLCDLVNKLETQLYDRHKSVGNMLADHVLGVDAKVTKCCETLASNSSSASLSVAANVVRNWKIKLLQENCVLFYIPESDALKSEADHNYVSKICKDTCDLELKFCKHSILARK